MDKEIRARINKKNMFQHQKLNSMSTQTSTAKLKSSLTLIHHMRKDTKSGDYVSMMATSVNRLSTVAKLRKMIRKIPQSRRKSNYTTASRITVQPKKWGMMKYHRKNYSIIIRAKNKSKVSRRHSKMTRS